MMNINIRIEKSYDTEILHIDEDGNEYSRSEPCWLIFLEGELVQKTYDDCPAKDVEMIVRMVHAHR